MLFAFTRALAPGGTLNDDAFIAAVVRDAGACAQAGRWEPGDLRAMAPDEQVAAERAVIAECYERILGSPGADPGGNGSSGC